MKNLNLGISEGIFNGKTENDKAEKIQNFT